MTGPFDAAEVTKVIAGAPCLQNRPWDLCTHSTCAATAIADWLNSRLPEELRRLDTENRQLREGINGTDWENDLLVNAPDWFDGDEAQSEIVTRYVRWLERQQPKGVIPGPDDEARYE